MQGTFVDVFLRRVDASPDAPALRFRDGDRWSERSWRGWHERSRAVAAGLIALGVEPGGSVAILSATRVEWLIADMGILMAGAVTVPIYPSTLDAECAYILEDSGARVVIVEDAAQLAKLAAVRDRLPFVEKIVCFDGPSDGWAIGWDQFTSFEPVRGAEVDARAERLCPDDVCTIVYTSGTTGTPKGVVLTHGALRFECEAVLELGIGESDVQLLFLPLAHVFARVLYAAFVRAGGVTAVSGVATVLDDLKTVQPTIVGAVPRIFEKIHAKALSTAEDAGGLRLALFQWAAGVGRDVCRAHAAGRPVGGALRLKHAVAMKLAGERLKQRFGGRIRFLVSGGAPLPAVIAEFFFGFGLEILEGYGLTETTAATHVNRPGRARFGTVGPPLAGVEQRLAEDGEILVRGPNVMRGYHNKPAETAAVLSEDGWLATGDIGEIDPDGTLRVTDRKKDLIKTSGGKYVAPQLVEGLLKTHPLISQAMVHGDCRSFVSALITLDADGVASWAREQGLDSGDYAELTRRSEVYELVRGIVAEKNAELPSYETIKKFAILDHDFSQDGGELTPTLKVKRKFVTEKNQALLDSFYTEHY